MLDYQHTNAFVQLPIDDGVGKVGRGKAASTPCARRAESRVGQEQLRNALELGEKARSERWRALARVEGCGFLEVALCARM